MLLDNADFLPSSTDVVLWRYLDFAKFVSLLESQALHFARADTFEDPFEGEWSHADVQRIRDPLRNGGNAPGTLEHHIRDRRKNRQEMFISCWHQSQHESDAMWKLYLQSSAGVAIQTTLSRLSCELERAPLVIGIGSVQYIDYEVEMTNTNYVYSPFLHKRQSFFHEREVRALIWREQAINERLIAKASAGIQVHVNLDQLIHVIKIAPTAPPWFDSLVGNVCARYGLGSPVSRSDLLNLPQY